VVREVGGGRSERLNREKESGMGIGKGASRNKRKDRVLVNAALTRKNTWREEGRKVRRKSWYNEKSYMVKTNPKKLGRKNDGVQSYNRKGRKIEGRGVWEEEDRVE